MPASTRSSHPDHAREQAHIERAHRAELARRKSLEHSAESAGDKVTAREMRRIAMERLQHPVDLESLCFGRIDLEGGKSLHLGRGAVRDDELLVINWRLPIAAPFYEASKNDPCGLARRRRFELDGVRLLSIIDENFSSSAAPAVPRPPATRPVAQRFPPPASPQRTPDDGSEAAPAFTPH